METGIEFLDALDCPTIIICVCTNPAECHTSLIKDELDRRGYITQEMRPAPKPSKPDMKIALF